MIGGKIMYKGLSLDKLKNMTSKIMEHNTKKWNNRAARRRKIKKYKTDRSGTRIKV